MGGLVRLMEEIEHSSKNLHNSHTSSVQPPRRCHVDDSRLGVDRDCALCTQGSRLSKLNVVVRVCYLTVRLLATDCCDHAYRESLMVCVRLDTGTWCIHPGPGVSKFGWIGCTIL